MNSYFFVTAKPNACDFFIYHITDQVSCYENHRLNRIKKMMAILLAYYAASCAAIFCYT
jgi:hypothetical protein